MNSSIFIYNPNRQWPRLEFHKVGFHISRMFLIVLVLICLTIGCGWQNKQANDSSSKEKKSSAKTDSDPKTNSKTVQKKDTKDSKSEKNPTRTVQPVAPFTQLKLLKSLEVDVLSVRAFAFAKDNQTFVTGGNTPKIWKLGTDEPLHEFDELYPIAGTVIECDSIAISPDGATLALGASDGSLAFFEMTTRKQKNSYVLHEKGIVSLSYSKNGKYLLTSSYDGKARLVEAESGNVISTVKGDEDRAAHAAMTGDGKVGVVVGKDAAVWNMVTGKKIGPLDLGQPREMRVMVATISSDGKLIATGEATTDFKPAVLIWSVETRKLVVTLKHQLGVMSMAFSPDGKFLATAGLDTKAHIWRIADAQMVQTIEETELNSIEDVVWSPNGKLLAVICEGTIRFWGVEGALD